jgi:hypothetical protein
MRKWILLGTSFCALSACGGGAEPGSDTSVPAAKSGSTATAVVRIADNFSVEWKQIEWHFVDGIALRTDDGPVALLTTDPIDACTRLAALARGSTDLRAFANAGAPVLIVVRNERYPQGSVQLIEPLSSMYLSSMYLMEAIPTLQTDGDRLVAKGQEPGDEPFADKPSLEYDINLAYASMAEFDPLAADAGPEAQWLRGLVQQARAGTEADVTATFFVDEDEDEWDSYSSRTTWFSVLKNWKDFNVIAAASGPDCATLVLQSPGFVGGSRKAIVRARGAGDQRKVFAAETSEDHGSEGNYVVGRVEHQALGAFPILDARAEGVADTGTVVIFSDGPIGEATWEQLVQKQRAVRAVTTDGFSNIYMLRTLEFAGPGVAAETVAARNIANAYIDETKIAGLIKQGEAGEPRIVANYRLPLKAPASAP